MLWQRCHEMSLSELDTPDLALEIAQLLFQAQPTLIDIAAAVGCHCCGVTAENTGVSARVAVTSLEPPRSSTPVMVDAILPDLSLTVVPDDAEEVTGVGAPSVVSVRPPMAVTPASALTSRR
jgi:hypothetical protein